MAVQATSVGPLHAKVAAQDQSEVDALVLAFRWNDAHPDQIDAYLVKLASGSPNELTWIEPSAIRRFIVPEHDRGRMSFSVVPR